MDCPPHRPPPRASCVRVVALALALAVAAPGAAVAQTLSPGPLSRAHAKWDTPDGCGRCHTTGRDVGEALCLDCHPVTARALRASRGFHARLVQRSGKRCDQCHREHHGRDYDLIHFEAQVPDFRHDQTGFALEGRHERLACAACHRGRNRYHGVSARCASCHEDRHGEQLGDACERCHGVTSFAPAARFDHARADFPLRGRHRGVACAKCHPERTTPAGARDRRWTGVPHAACGDCHADPHGGTMAGACGDCHTTDGWRQVAALAPWAHAPGRFPLVGRHAETGCAACHGVKMDRPVGPQCASCHRDPHAGRFGADCALCHTAAGWKEIADEAVRDHAPGRFPLTGRHRRLSCAQCHGPDMERRVSPDCASCHREPHAGRFGERCGDCHGAASWRVRLGGAFRHERTDYPLEGAHRTVACVACHEGGGSYRERYAAVPHERCRDCHEDAHGRTFGSVERGDRCDACHTVAGFVPATYGRDEHARAAFPLEGAHRAVPCDRCHRPPGARTVRLTLAGATCRSCHDDVHRGAFDERMGARGCATCHGTTSWSVTAFDHATTRFPLTGRHASIDCAACHGADTGGAAATFVGLDRRCASCHVDPHFGQFAAPVGDGSAKGCGDCHGTASFAIPSFDHAAQAGWPLDGAHARVAEERAGCRRCHAAVDLPDGGRAVVWRRPGGDCAGCHADPHRGLDGMACATCHGTGAWRDLRSDVDFAHESTGFPLRGRHRGVACARCHGADRARPSGAGVRGCADCHDDPHAGRQGDACGDCHTERGWAVPAALRAHDGTRFPLVGAHRTADCVACHAAQVPDAYRATPRACFACHADAYGRPDNHPDHVAAAFPVRCEECHGQYAWQGARVTHGWWPLRGAHAATDCFRCHVGGRYAGTPTACEGCHRDDYEGTTTPDHAAAGFPLRCADCHAEVAWQPARGDWHDRFFPIDRGDHRGLGCADCHPGGAAVGFTCTGCHAHGRAETDGEHREVRGYAYRDGACLGCHPRGDD